jgi:alanine racemase
MGDLLTNTRLTVRLDAVVANYRHVQATLGPVPAGAAVKADAYGLGIAPVATALAGAGCREFFVASVEEGIELRSFLRAATINVFNGAMPGTEVDLIAHDLVPLIVSHEQLVGWVQASDGRRLPAGLHFDTGMNRTGIPATEVDDIAALVEGINVRHVLSHLASSADPESPQSEEQLARFRALRLRFPMGVASLANSGGIFRSSDFHFGLARPGIALYGGTPQAGSDNPMRQTVVLEAPIVQLRDIEPGERVGYNATFEVTAPSRHAVVPVGYADGFLRSESNSGMMSVGGHAAPVVGRVSMDLTVIDVTQVPAQHLALGAPVELIGDHCPIDDVAAAGDTIAYEMLTSLGRRYDRVYVGD